MALESAKSILDCDLPEFEDPSTRWRVATGTRGTAEVLERERVVGAGLVNADTAQSR